MAVVAAAVVAFAGVGASGEIVPREASASTGHAVPATPGSAAEASTVPARSSPAQTAAKSARRYNVSATHSPRLLHDLSGPLDRTGIRNRAFFQQPASAVSAAGVLRGVDVASFQHPGGAAISWTDVARAGYKFAAIKATEGNYYKNPYYPTDSAQATAAGLFVAAYAFAIPNVSDGTSQADYLASYARYKIGGRFLPVMADLEYDPYASSDGTNECYGLSPSAMVNWISRFVTEMRKLTGQPPIIYTTADWWDTCTGNSTAFRSDMLWVAAYAISTPPLPAGWNDWNFWQYTSSGTVTGINTPGATDLDYFSMGPGTQQTLAGSAASAQVRSLNALARQAVTYSATGLPPGLSINPGGRISGWPYRAGTYQVKVTAADRQTSETTSFTWTITPAADAGTAGPFRLDNGGKCLDDTRYSTTNGTRMEIWTCSGGTNQRWTVVQDGTLRVLGKCLDVYQGGSANGTPVDLYSCNGTGAQRWQIGTRGELVNPQSGKCLNDPHANTTNGTKLDIYSCTGAANERWTGPPSPFPLGIPGKCLDDTGNSTVNGTRMEIWTCDGGTNQHWTVPPDGTIRIYGKCLTVQGSGTASGTPVDIYGCTGSAGQAWRMVPQGPIGSDLVNPHSGLCLADPGDSATNGTKLVIAPCPARADPGTSWHVM